MLLMHKRTEVDAFTSQNYLEQVNLTINALQ